MKKSLLFIPFIIYGCICLWSMDNIFFWDTVQLGAKHAFHFYENGSSQWLLPDDIDSGHIPIFGMYLALMWTVFGKSLIVSHIAMWPFVIGILHQGYKWITRKVDTNYVPYAFLILMLEPTLMAQCSLVSPDVVLMYAFIHLINVIEAQEKSWLKYALVVLLGLISMRGAMILAVLFVYECYISQRPQDLLKHCISKLKFYLPAFLIWTAYMGYHYHVKGWIGYHIDSPWASSFAKADLSKMVKNIAIMGWRMIDFGRFGLYIIIATALLSKTSTFWPKGKNMIVLCSLLTLGLGYSFVAFAGLQGHRYLLPLYWVAATIAVLGLQSLTKYRIAATMTLIFCLITGHLWRYPFGVSQGWDASLAYAPYMSAREQMYILIDQQNIPNNEISSSFPNKSEQRFMDLSDSRQSHTAIEIGKSPYILWSNIYNEIQPETLQDIRQKYMSVCIVVRAGVRLELFKLK